MDNHLATKARAILSHASGLAERLQMEAEALQEQGKLDVETMLYLKQDAIRNLVLSAQAYATLATIPEVHTAEEALPEEPTEDEPAPDVFAAFMGGNPLDLLEKAVQIGRAFERPRPVKDSPQA